MRFRNYQEILQKTFQHCADVSHETFVLQTKTEPVHILMIYCPGLIDEEKLNKEVIPELEEISRGVPATELQGSLIEEKWKKYPLTLLKDVKEISAAVFDGQLLFHIPLSNTAYLVDISKHPQRNPEETRTEISIRGARDGFIEEIRVNAALIRKRVRSNSLHYEEFIIGQRSKTKVGLFYIAELTSSRMIKEVKQQLNNIEIDGLLNTNQLEELLLPSNTRFFPLFNYTGRPDFVAQSLLNGRFALLVDGSPTALIAPVTLSFLLQAGEDNATYFPYNSFERFLRFIGLLLATSLPGFWVALVSFHQNELPFILLANLAQVRQGVPLPFAFEAFVMIIIFEIFREAGLRLPSQIGQILSVVGGLIIGDAAIRAGLTSPGMIVIIASSAVANFVLVHQSLAGTISIIRIYILAFSSFLGMFGFLFASFSVLVYVANLRSYGLPYLSPLAPFHWRDFLHTIFRPSWQRKRKRPLLTTENLDERQDDEP